MSTVTKHDLIKAVASKSKTTQHVTTRVVESFLDEITLCLERGDRVEFRGFGIWEAKLGKSRIGRNPMNLNAGEIHIPARPVLRFKSGNKLRAAVLKSKPEKP